MKKAIFMFLVIIFLFLITSCSSDNKNTEEAVSEIPEEEPVNVPVEEKVESEAAEVIEEVKIITSPEEFGILVMESSMMIVEDTSILTGYGDSEISFWKTVEDTAEFVTGEGEKPNNDSIIESADEWLLETYEITRKDLEENYKKITEKHSDIIGANIDDDTSIEIREKYEALYLSYNDLYLTVTNPSGTLEDFTIKYAEIGTDIINTMKDLLNSFE